MTPMTLLLLSLCAASNEDAAPQPYEPPQPTPRRPRPLPEPAPRYEPTPPPSGPVTRPCRVCGAPAGAVCDPARLGKAGKRGATFHGSR